jgi:competence protein ComEC
MIRKLMPSCPDGYLCSAKKYWADLPAAEPTIWCSFELALRLLRALTLLTDVKRTLRLYLEQSSGLGSGMLGEVEGRVVRTPGGRVCGPAPPVAVSLAESPDLHGLRAPSATGRRDVRSSARRIFGFNARGVMTVLTASIEEERRHGHAFLFVPVAIGLGALIWFSLPHDLPLWPWLVLVAVAFAVLLLLTDETARLMSMAAGFVMLGMVLAGAETWRRATVVLDSPVTTNLAGIVERSERSSGGQVRYTVSVVTTTDPQLRRPPTRVTLVARSAHELLRNGDPISGRVRISPPSGPALPGLHDFGFSAYFDGIGAVGYFYGPPQRGTTMPAAPTLGERAGRFIFDLRLQIGNRIRDIAPGDAGAFAAAIVTDERRAISEETVEALRVSGLAHIVAISGLNMALAAGIFFVGLRSLLALFPPVAQAWPVKKIAAAGALAMVTGYYLISGFGVSAQRAYIMMAVMLVAVLVDRPSISLRNVAVSALIILAWTPSEILGPSFQMSFAATAALVAGYAAWAGRARRHHFEPLPFRHPLVTLAAKVGTFIGGLVLTSMIGGLSTTMFSIEHFHRLAAYGLAANLAAMPIISFITMPAGLAAMLLMPFGLDAPFLVIMAGSLDWVIAIARHVAGWGGDIGMGRPHPWFLPLGVVGFLLLTLLRTRLRLSGILFLSASLAVFSLGPDRPAASLLISEDGTLVGLRSGATIALSRTRAPDFIYDQWTRAEKLQSAIKPVLLPGDDKVTAAEEREARLSADDIDRARDTMKGAGGDRFTCQPKSWCAILSAEGVLVVVVEDGRYAGAACDVAGLIIAARARFETCRSGAPLLTGSVLKKTGAIDLDFAGSLEPDEWQVRTAMAEISRPWHVHRQYDWRRDVYDAALPAWLTPDRDRNAAVSQQRAALPGTDISGAEARSGPFERADPDISGLSDSGE